MEILFIIHYEYHHYNFKREAQKKPALPRALSTHIILSCAKMMLLAIHIPSPTPWAPRYPEFFTCSNFPNFVPSPGEYFGACIRHADKRVAHPTSAVG